MYKEYSHREETGVTQSRQLIRQQVMYKEYSHREETGVTQSRQIESLLLSAFIAELAYTKDGQAQSCGIG